MNKATVTRLLEGLSLPDAEARLWTERIKKADDGQQDGREELQRCYDQLVRKVGVAGHQHKRSPIHHTR
jgi:hypothetical protein